MDRIIPAALVGRNAPTGAHPRPFMTRRRVRCVGCRVAGRCAAGHHDARREGWVQARVETQIPQGRGLFLRGIRLVASYVRAHPRPFACGVSFLVPFAMIALVATDPFLALIGFLLFPTLALLNRSFARRMEDPVRRAQERIGEVSAVAHESVDGALIVKTLGREDAEAERLGRKAQALRDERVAAGYVRAGFEPALEALPTLGTVLLLAVGAWRASTGAVTVGDLIEFVTLF